MSHIVIILDDNNPDIPNLPIVTFGPYDSKEEAIELARHYFNEMDKLFPEFAMGYSYEVKATHSFDTAMSRVAAEILIQTRRDPYMRGDNWDGYMGEEYGCV
jgi:hypothetical protein